MVSFCVSGEIHYPFSKMDLKTLVLKRKICYDG